MREYVAHDVAGRLAVAAGALQPAGGRGGGGSGANRTRAEVEGLIGFFVNTLVLRTEVVGELRVRELLQRACGSLSGSLRHPEVPFEMLVEELQPERNMSHTPLFQVMFTLQTNLQTAGLGCGDSDCE